MLQEPRRAVGDKDASSPVFSSSTACDADVHGIPVGLKARNDALRRLLEAVDLHVVRQRPIGARNGDKGIVEGPLDVLDHSSPMAKWGSKMGIDATKTWPEEGHTREWPEEISMSEEIKARVDAKWKELGLD